jgi:hypothetical protein
MTRIYGREYPLPFGLNDLYLLPPLDPWLARFCGLPADRVAEILRTEWDAITTPAVACFRDAVLPFQPASIFHDASEEWYEGWWLRMVRPETDGLLPVSWSTSNGSTPQGLDIYQRAVVDDPLTFPFLSQAALNSLGVA